MKTIITIVLAMFVILWYADYGSISAVLHENENVLSVKEIKNLADIGVLQTPINYDKEYFSTEKTRFFKTKTLIPLFYKRDTISYKGLEYYSRNPY